LSNCCRRKAAAVTTLRRPIPGQPRRPVSGGRPGPGQRRQCDWALAVQRDQRQAAWACESPTSRFGDRVGKRLSDLHCGSDDQQLPQLRANPLGRDSVVIVRRNPIRPMRPDCATPSMD
jgi:hypothetical protein